MKPYGCVTTYRVGTAIDGPLEKVLIAPKRHVWYFEEEEIWKERWVEAKKLLAHIKAKREKAENEAAKVRAEALAKRREIGLTGSLPVAGVGQNRREVNGQLGAKEPEQNTESNRPDIGSRGSWPAAVNIKEYRCSKCKGLFFQADMVLYKRITKEGVCRECLYGRR